MLYFNRRAKLFGLLCLVLLASAFGVVTFDLPQVEWGEEHKDKTRVYQVLGEQDGKVYTLSERKKKTYLDVYDADLKKDNAYEIETPEIDGKKVDLLYYNLLNGKMVALAAHYDKKDKKESLYAYELTDKGRLKDRRELMTFDVENKRRRATFTINESMRKNALVVTALSVHRKGKDDKKKLNIIALDKELQTIHESHTSYPLKVKQKGRNNDVTYSLASTEVDDNGSAYVLMKKNIGSGSKKLTDFELLTNTKQNGYKGKRFKVSGRGRMITKATIFLDNDQLRIGGFYKEDPKGLFNFEGVSGTFLATLDITKDELDKIDFKRLPKKYIAEFIGEKRAKKGKLPSPFFVPKDIVVKQGGGAVMVAEDSYKVVTESRSAIQTRYYDNDLMIISFDKDGEIEWMRRIGKKQMYAHTRPKMGLALGGLSFNFAIGKRVVDTDFMSYLMGVKGDKIYIVFNDHRKNIEREEDELKTLSRFKNGIPMVGILDMEGNYEREVIPGGKDDAVILRPGTSLQINKNEMIVYGARSSKDKLGRIRF